MSDLQFILTIAVCAAATMLTRFLPFLVFGSRGGRVPEVVEYLGHVLLAAIFGMLIVYCLKGVGLAAQIQIRRAVQPGFDGFCPVGKFLLIHRDRLLSALFCLLDGAVPRFVLTKRNLFRKNRQGFCPAGCYACAYALGCAFW